MSEAAKVIAPRSPRFRFENRDIERIEKVAVNSPKIDWQSSKEIVSSVSGDDYLEKRVARGAASGRIISLSSSPP